MIHKLLDRCNLVLNETDQMTPEKLGLLLSHRLEDPRGIFRQLRQQSRTLEAQTDKIGLRVERSRCWWLVDEELVERPHQDEEIGQHLWSKEGENLQDESSAWLERPEAGLDLSPDQGKGELLLLILLSGDIEATVRRVEVDLASQLCEDGRNLWIGQVTRRPEGSFVRLELSDEDATGVRRDQAEDILKWLSC